MEKIIKKYSQAQAWHDPKRWKPQDKPFAVIINEGNNQYSFAIATDLFKSDNKGVLGLSEDEIPECWHAYEVWNNEQQYICEYENVVLWAYVDDLVPAKYQKELIIL